MGLWGDGRRLPRASCINWLARLALRCCWDKWARAVTPNLCCRMLDELVELGVLGWGVTRLCKNAHTRLVNTLLYSTTQYSTVHLLSGPKLAEILAHRSRRVAACWLHVLTWQREGRRESLGQGCGDAGAGCEWRRC